MLTVGVAVVGDEDEGGPLELALRSQLLDDSREAAIDGERGGQRAAPTAPDPPLARRRDRRQPLQKAGFVREVALVEGRRAGQFGVGESAEVGGGGNGALAAAALAAAAAIVIVRREGVELQVEGCVERRVVADDPAAILLRTSER